MILPLFILVLVIALHFLANTFGIYDAQIAAGEVWIDNALHLLVGFSFAWWWMTLSKVEGTSFACIATSTIAFVAALAVAWELCEWAFYVFSPDYAIQFKIYSESLQEAGMDILSNLAGAILFLLGRLMWRR